MKRRNRTGSRILRGSLVTLLLLAAAGAFIRWNGVSRTPGQWWYPFIPALFSDHYTAGPFAMTSNTREDNPVWSQIAGFNRMQARLSYVATRGEPRAQVAWLLADAEWKDQLEDPSRAARALVTQFPNVPSFTPRSRATCAIGFLVSSTIRTAPSRNSRSYFFLISGISILIVDASTVRGEPHLDSADQSPGTGGHRGLNRREVNYRSRVVEPASNLGGQLARVGQIEPPQSHAAASRSLFASESISSTRSLWET